MRRTTDSGFVCFPERYVSRQSDRRVALVPRHQILFTLAVPIRSFVIVEHVHAPSDRDDESQILSASLFGIRSHMEVDSDTSGGADASAGRNTRRHFGHVLST